MKNPFYYIIPLFLIVSCSTQKDAKDSSEKSKISFDQKLADSLGADQYGMKPYVIVILKTGKANITDK